jgi:WD40 repeat protein
MIIQAFGQRTFGNEYVLHLAPVRKHGLVASLSNNSLNVVPFDPMELKTSTDGRVIKNAHEGSITGLKTIDENNVVSCGEDGMKLWDLRTNCNGPAQTFVPDSGSPLCCLDVQASKLVAGTQLVGVDAGVVFWDIRKGNKQSMAYVDSHSDDVTEVQFHPTDPFGLLSGSTDGLINIYNTSIEDEDDAVYNAINNGASIHRAGFIQSKDGVNKVFALSHMETFSVYHIANPDDESETPAPVEFGDIREKWNCQYVADVLNGFIAVGSNNNASTFNFLPYDNDASVDTANPISLKDAHGEEVVRCVHMDNQYQCIYTGGEDGIIKVWKPESSLNIPEPSLSEIADGDSEWETTQKKKDKKDKKDKKKDKKQKEKKKEKRYAPY